MVAATSTTTQRSALAAILDRVRGPARSSGPASNLGVASAPEHPGATHVPRRAAGTVRFEQVGKIFHSSAGSVTALEDISLEVPAGSIYGIIGRSGAGKSSLLRTINRLERPSTGRVLVDDIDVGVLDDDGLVALRRRVGMIFQHFNLLSAKTVRDNVALPLKVAGVAPAEVERRVTELLDLVGLDSKRGTFPRRLSGGQKQRVGIARALVHHPEILLCDEATSALDPETTQSILALLRDINHRLGLTIVLITHEMGVIREICDQVLVLEQGRIAEQGPVWQVFGNPTHDVTRVLLEPLARGLPADLATRLVAEPPASDPHDQVIELRFTGEAGIEPDLSRIAAALRAPARLLYGSLDRIQGHTHGHLVLAIRNGAVAAQTLVAHGLAHHAKVLGYVANHD